MNRETKFLSVLDTHKGILYKVANNYCRDPEERPDLIQEITFQLWRSFETYDERSKYSTWIYRIALNVAISYYRKQRKITTGNVPLSGDIIVLAEPAADTETDDRIRQLEQFIRELKDMDRAIMLLYLEEKSYREIAEIIGLSETNVGTKVSRIKTLLFEKFKKHG